MEEPAEETDVTRDDHAVPSIAVIGASVRGTSALERLTASADTPVVVHVIDPHPPGSGRIWRDGQSDRLVMNTVAAQSTLFTDETVACGGPVRPGPSLAQWCRRVTADPALVDLPPAVRAEAERTSDHANPSRLLYGHYLRWCFAEIVRTAPAHVEVRVHAATAVDLRPREESGWTVALDDGTNVVADAVILALGWLARDDIPRHARVVAPGNPIDQDLSAVAPGSAVAVRGLGMGFFDTLSQLTEQRGGIFEPQGDGSFRYERSGAEPIIVAGSRRGMPYRAKPDFGAPPFFPEQRILRAALPELMAKRPVDFTRDVLPLIERDAAHDYYRALDRVAPGSVRDVDTVLASLRQSHEPIADIAARHVSDTSTHLDLAAAADPLADIAAPTDAEVVEAVRADVAEAARGVDSPLKLALHSYAAARGALIDLVAFGGLTEHSYAAYRIYLQTAAAFGSGPPLARSRQLLAAHEAGVVRFAGRGLRATPDADGIALAASDPHVVRADRLVEAWLPAPTATRAADPLVRSLLAQGLIRPWRFPDGTTSDAIDIRADDGALIGADGRPTPGLFSIGVPHEDIRVFTIIAPVPGTNSSVLREADAAARAALRAAHPSPHSTRSLRTAVLEDS